MKNPKMKLNLFMAAIAVMIFAMATGVFAQVDLTDTLLSTAFSASSTYVYSSPAGAFDNVEDTSGNGYSTQWYCNNYWSVGEWLKVDFGAGNGKKITKLTIITKHTWLDNLLAVVTLYIYCPVTVTVQGTTSQAGPTSP